MTAPNDKKQPRTGLDVAVIGMSIRFPGAPDIETFWNNLKNGVESVSFFSLDQLAENGVPANMLQDPHFVPAMAAIDDKDAFDPGFFDYSPMEAEVMDPQTRLFHQHTWEALENAGYNPDEFPGLIGIYGGSTHHIEREGHALLSEEGQNLGAFESSMMAGSDFMISRVSYKLNLKGPAVSIQTACSTSLVAIHIACRALITGECDMAIAGGATIISPNKTGYVYQEGMVMSPDGHCRTFDADAKGFVGGEGIGVVVLRRLKDALADRDIIYAVVKGSAINNDGTRKPGYTAPSVEGQTDVIKRALHMTRFEPESITYIETHGTATPIGDPIEFKALTLALKPADPTKKHYCGLGSVKSNFGHLDNAAGIAGFIKTILALKHKMIPPSLFFHSPNPAIDFTNTPFYVNTTLKEWKNDAFPLRAGVSSFGIGGTNAHVILEEAPVEQLETAGTAPGTWTGRDMDLILLSAKTRGALDAMVSNLAGFFKINRGTPLHDAAYTLHVGRKVFHHRCMISAGNIDEAIERLTDEEGKKRFYFSAAENQRNRKPKLIFMFPGLGAEYVNMGRELYEKEPLFCSTMDTCFEILTNLTGIDYKEILYPPETEKKGDSQETPLRGDLLWRQAPSGGLLNGQPLHKKELSINNYQLTINNEREKGDSQETPLRGGAFAVPGYSNDFQKSIDSDNIDNSFKNNNSNKSFSGGPGGDFSRKEPPGLTDTGITSPLVFVFEYALAKLLMQWGIVPDALIGYSFGEYVAACISGVFSLEDALNLITVRGRLIDKTETGAMLSIPLTKEELLRLLPGELSLAIDNDISCIAAGREADVVSFENVLKEKKYICMRLQTKKAVHSPTMESIRDEFERRLGEVKLNALGVPYISNVSGSWISGEQASNPHYWSAHLRHTVRFADGIKELLKLDENSIFLEVGPGKDLSALLVRYIPKSPEQRIINLVRHPLKEVPDVSYLLDKVGRLWLYGRKIDWSGFYKDQERRRIPLPTYPFEKKRFPFAKGDQLKTLVKQSLIEKNPKPEEWFYQPSWKQKKLSEPFYKKVPTPPKIFINENNKSFSGGEGGGFFQKEPPGKKGDRHEKEWLVFAEGTGAELPRVLAEGLKALNGPVTWVFKGKTFEKQSHDVYIIDPSISEHYIKLFKELEHIYKSFSGGPGGDFSRKEPPGHQKQNSDFRILHMWNVDGEESSGESFEIKQDELEKNLELGFFSLLYIAQAMDAVGGVDSCDITVLTDNMQSVVGEFVLKPGKSALLGPLKVIPQEFPGISCRSIDIMVPAPGTREFYRLAEQLLKEIAVPVSVSTSNMDTEVAFRGNRRWVLGYEPVPLRGDVLLNAERGMLNAEFGRTHRFAPTEIDNILPNETYPENKVNNQKLLEVQKTFLEKVSGRRRQYIAFRDNGIYLITGGLGGVGLILAEGLYKHLGARLVLVGRTAVPCREEWEEYLKTHEAGDAVSGKIRAVMELESMGAEVLAMSGDVSNENRMRAVVEEAEKRFGAIHGVIHAAGIVEGDSVQTLRSLDKKACMEQFMPKVYGLLVLEKIFRGKRLDFCLLMSSMSSILGGLGFGAYSAANLFMDGFVNYLRLPGLESDGNGCHWVSVNWEGWQKKDAGDVSGLGGGALGDSLARLALTPEEGFDALMRILCWEDGIQVVTSTGDLPARIDRWLHIKTEPVMEDEGSEGAKIEGSTRPHLSTSYTAPADDVEQRLAAVWERFLGVHPIGITDDFFELGGDSLKAINITGVIQRRFHAKLRVEEFFKNPTIKSLAVHIRGMEKHDMRGIERAQEKGYYALSASEKRMFILNQFIDYQIPIAMVMEGEVDKDRFENVFKQMMERHEILRTSFEMQDGEPVQQVHKHIDFKVDYYKLDSQSKTVSFEDLTGNPEFSSIIKDFFRPYDLAVPPLMRAALVEIPAGNGAQARHLFLFNIHHIISDGTSLGVMIREFMALYNGQDLPAPTIQYKDFSEWEREFFTTPEFKKQENYWLNLYSGEIPVMNMPIDFPRPPVQDFEGSAVHLNIGGQTLENMRNLVQKENTSIYMTLMAVYYTLLSRYANQDDLVIGTIVAGRGQEETHELMGVFINTLALRNYPARGKTFVAFLEEVKTNTLKGFENQQYPFGDLLDKVEVKKDLSRTPLFDVMMIFQNMDLPAFELDRITFQPFPAVNRLMEQFTHAQHDITLWGVEDDDEIQLTFEYGVKLFKRETMERLTGHFQRILETVLQDNNAALGDIDLLSQEEKEQLLLDFNGKDAEFPADKTFVDIFEENAQQYPDCIAVTGEQYCPGSSSPSWMHLTYKELNERAEKLAFSLRQDGVGRDVVVGISFERRVEMIIGIMGILEAGAAYLPIDPSYPQERIDYMIADSAAHLILSGSDKIQNAERGVLNTEGERGLSRSSRRTPREKEDRNEVQILTEPDHSGYVAQYNGTANDPTRSVEKGDSQIKSQLSINNYQLTINNENNSLAYVIYTSGSTGKPKGVMVNHDSFANALWAWKKEYGLNKEKTEINLLQIANFSFDVFAGDIARSLGTGGKLTICPEETRLDPPSMYTLIIKEKITLFESTPSLVLPFMDYIYTKNLDLGTLRLLIIGSDTLRTDDFQLLMTRFPKGLRIINSYGVTEATIDSSFYEGKTGTATISGNVPIGKPLPNTKFFILDKNMNLQPIGVPGELLIGGSCIARGYLNRPELTAERLISKTKTLFEKRVLDSQKLLLNKSFCGGPGGDFHEKSPLGILYKTGDLARWLPDGNVEFLGRADFQVKIRGYRVELKEIESRLRKSSAIKDVVVLAFEGEYKFLCAFYVLAVGQEGLDVSELRGFLSGKLPDYMIPSHFVPIESIPLTPNGKIDVWGLRELYRSKDFEKGTGKNFVPAVTEVEKTLAVMWEEVLQKEQVGLYDNFFDLGGQSLLAMKLTMRIRDTFNVKIPLAEFFQVSTVKGLSDIIERDRIKDTGQNLPQGLSTAKADEKEKPASPGVKFEKRKRAEREIKDLDLEE